MAGEEGWKGCFAEKGEPRELGAKLFESCGPGRDAMLASVFSLVCLLNYPEETRLTNRYLVPSG